MLTKNGGLIPTKDIISADRLALAPIRLTLPINVCPKYVRRYLSTEETSPETIVPNQLLADQFFVSVLDTSTVFNASTAKASNAATPTFLVTSQRCSLPSCIEGG